MIPLAGGAYWLSIRLKRGILKLNNNLLEIERKLSLLGITSKYGENPNREVKKIEETLSLTLPMEYKRFLQKFGTLNFNDTEIAFYPETPIEEDFFTIVNFYGLTGDNHDLKLIINRYEFRIPNDLIPIAECPGGDQLCIGINNKTFGKIYYWNHNKEKLQVNTIEELWEPINLIYDSFFDLIMSIQELQESEDFDDSIIESIKVSDKFLSRFNQR